MRTLDGDMVLARVVMGDSDKWHHRPLYRALVERLREEGFAGATVFHATLGFGARSIVHTSSIVDLSSDLPIVVEVVDTEENIQRLVPILDEMMTSGLVMIEKARVIRYGDAKPHGAKPGA
jgi:PII-like signaling protein